MCDAPRLATDRLILRGWRDADRDAFAAMNADPEVMRHFPETATRAESDAALDKMCEKWAEDGLCWWAVDHRDGGFIGFVGLNKPRITTHFTPCVEVGWRLVRTAWGNGYATEAARAALDWGFGEKRLEEIISMTVPANTASLAVMRRLGMRRDLAGDFDHPMIAEGHPLRRHVLYRLDRTDWQAA